jgi:hypothetical protein
MSKPTEHPSSAFVRGLCPEMDLDAQLAALIAAVWDRAYAAGHAAGAREFGRGWDAAVGMMRGGHDR